MSTEDIDPLEPGEEGEEEEGEAAEAGDNESVTSDTHAAAEEGDVDAEGEVVAEEPVMPTYAIVRNVDLPEDTKTDITDFVVAAVEHNLGDYVAACKSIKENLDRIYGPGWHAIVGECFGFEISHDALHFVNVFYNGNLGILVWKCTANV